MAVSRDFLRNRRLQVRILPRASVTPYKTNYLRLVLFFAKNRMGVFGLAWACRSALPRSEGASPLPVYWGSTARIACLQRPELIGDLIPRDRAWTARGRGVYNFPELI